jgi:hypothetical protein
MGEKPRREHRWNGAQADRGAAETELKKCTETADIRDGEPWRHPRGHGGAHRAWLGVGLILAGALLVASGLTFGPLFLVWIGVAVALIAGAVSVSARVWSGGERH